MDSTEQNSIASRLSEVSMFREFTIDELRRMAKAGSIREIPSQAHAVIEGDPSRGLFIVLKGSVSIFKNNIQTGTMSRIGQLEEGSCFGEISLFEASPRSATVVADKNCQMFSLEFDPFEKFMTQEGVGLQLKFYRSCAVDLATRFRTLNQEFIASQNLLWQKAFAKEVKT